LIAILLLKYLKVRARYKWSLSNLVALLRLNLFTYRDLWEWIDLPTEPPPLVYPISEILKLDLRSNTYSMGSCQPGLARRCSFGQLLLKILID